MSYYGDILNVGGFNVVASKSSDDAGWIVAEVESIELQTRGLWLERSG